jgi:hypothetical protein
MRLVFASIFEEAIQESKEGILTSPIDYAAEHKDHLHSYTARVSFSFDF